MTIDLHRLHSRTLAPLAVALCLAALAGCGAGSGAAVSENPITTASITPTAFTYTGPPPASADVQRFKTNVWDNLQPDNRCGSCHAAGQDPQFVRTDDINLAYAAANTVVDLDTPSQSRLVTKVAEGHNCWLTSPQACADVIVRFIQAWAGDVAGDGFKTVALSAPPERTPGASKSFPASSSDFAARVHPLLTLHCAGCHSEGASVPQSPFFASSDLEVAYAAARPKIDLNSPANSRFVLRLASEFHNCWSSCSSDGSEMLAAISAFADGISVTPVDPNLVISRALTLDDGIVASTGGRFDASAIALWEFKAGQGDTAFDTSGVSPAINLSLIGDIEWVGGFGIRINSGRAQGTTSASAKLHDLITATNEFTLEAWVVPANVTQDGPARIFTYSAGTDARNFTLGQTLYNYDVLVRSADTDANGEPALSTPDDDEVLQATLQHVVLTYTLEEGRVLWVNGERVGLVEGAGSSLASWDDTFAVVLGNEPGNNRQWQGTIRLAAVHNRALTAEQIRQNFDAGVGAKFFLLFGVGHLVDIADAYILIEGSQFDSFSYLLNAPRFVTLSGTAPTTDIPIKGMRIGINGSEVNVGQAFANVDTVVNATDFGPDGQTLSPIGTIVGVDTGPGSDEFFLSFERIGAFENVRVEAAPPPPAAPADLPEVAHIGVRNFAEINATLAALTGISPTTPAVASVFDTVQQQLPTVESIDAFLSSHQMAVTQLGIEYCSALVDSPTRRAALFPAFDFDADVATAFDAAGRSALIDPLAARLLSTLPTQPDSTQLATELNALIDQLAMCGSDCSATRTRIVAKATCAAAFSSAAMLLQ